MRVIAIILAVAAVGSAAPTQRALVDSLQAFLDMFPWDRIGNIVDRHLENDGAFVDVVSYLQSDEWHDVARRIAALPGVQNFADFLANAEINVGEIFQDFDDGIMNAQFGTSPREESLWNFLGDMENVFPFEGIYGFFNGRLQEDPDLQKFYVKLVGEDAKEMLDEILSDPSVEQFERRLVRMGFNIDSFFSCVYDRNGWGRAPGAWPVKRDFMYPCAFTFFIFG